jgi:hypothetical protein
MVASRASAITVDRKARKERDTGLRYCPRLLQFTKLCQGSGKVEVPKGISSVSLDTPSQPSNRFRIFAVPQLGHTGKHHPQVGGDTARREAERLFDMSFRLYASAYHIFGHADRSVGASQIWIQCHSALALSDALSNSVCKNLNDAQDAMSLGMVRRQGQSFEHGRFSSQARIPAVTKEKVVGDENINPRRAE